VKKQENSLKKTLTPTRFIWDPNLTS